MTTKTVIFKGTIKGQRIAVCTALSFVFKITQFLPPHSSRFFLLSLSGQSYEVRMLDNRKPGELPELNNKMVKVRVSSQLEDSWTGTLLFLVSSTHLTWCVCVCVEHSASGFS